MKRWWGWVCGGGNGARETENKVFFDLLALGFRAVNIWRMSERKNRGEEIEVQRARTGASSSLRLIRIVEGGSDMSSWEGSTESPNEQQWADGRWRITQSDSRGNGVEGLVNGRRWSELLSEEALSPWDAVTRRWDRPQFITRQHRRRPMCLPNSLALHFLQATTHRSIVFISNTAEFFSVWHKACF